MNPAAVLSILVQAHGIAKTSAELKKLDATAKRTADSTEKVASKFSGLQGTLGDFNREMTSTGNVVKLVKFPALIAGAGMAAQTVGALAGAAVSLGSALAPLAGGAAAVGAGYAALGQAAGVAKLATIGLEDAISGQKGAMDKLSPVQRDFVKDIRALKQETQGLRGQAQRGLLPGLDKALQIVTPLIKTLTPIVGATARAMGDLAVSGARVVRTWGKDLQTIGRTNVTVIKNLGGAAIIAADAARHLIVAGGPLLKWLSELAVRGAEWVRTQIKAGRESGKLAGFLEQTKSVMSTLGHIVVNLASGFYEIGKAAAPLGRQILSDIEKLTERFKDWTQSLHGQVTLRQYFEDARGPVYEVFGLIGDLGKALLVLSKPGTESTGLIAQMRTLVPILQNVIVNTTAAFGPVLIDALANILRLFGDLAGTSGPLNLTVRLIGLLAGGLHSLLSSSPLLNQMTITTIGLVGSFKALAFVFGPLVAGVKALEVALVGQAAVAEAATAWTIRQRIALVVMAVQERITAVATKALAVATVLLNVAMTANPIGLVVVALVALGVGLVVAYKKVETFRNVVQGAFSWIKNNWPLLVAILTGPIGLAVLAITRNAEKIAAFFKALPGRIGSFLSGLPNLMLGIGRKMADAVIDGLSMLGHAILNKFKEAARFVIDNVGGFFKGIGGAITKAIPDISLPFGDGVGKEALPTVGSAALKGANPRLGPIAAIGAKMGLSVSSGLRPGAITSSGNVSYHSTGEAIDEAGSPPAMLRFFKFMKSRYGSRLAELIYTPGGAGIKNGHPYTYGGQVARDHYDHVHVAMDLGKPGVGDGIGKAQAALFAGMGDGPGKYSLQQLANLWVKAGGSPKLAGLMARIAQAESGGDPTARNKSGATGLWQILGAILPGNLTDPLVNARNAVAKYKSQGLGAWAASRSAWGKFVGHPGVSASKSAKAGTRRATQKINPFDLAIAQSDVALATAKQGSARIGGVGGRTVSSSLRQLGVLIARRKTISDRIKKVRGALKGKLTKPTRLRLTQELGSLLGQHADVQSQIRELRAPATAASTDLGTGGGGDLGGGGTGEDPNQPLIDAINAQIQAEKEHTDALTAVQTEMRRQTEFAQAATTTTNFQAWKALADMMSGQIVGRGVVSRAFTPGSGVEYRY